MNSTHKIFIAVPLGSLYNMSKFALEGLTEGLYYELKPLNISLHLIEPGGSTDNNFKNNIVWNASDDIKGYEVLSRKVSNLFNTTDTNFLDETSILVKTIAELSNGESDKFRTVIGKSGNDLVALRNSVPIEKYLETINAAFI